MTFANLRSGYGSALTYALVQCARLKWGHAKLKAKQSVQAALLLSSLTHTHKLLNAQSSKTGTGHAEQYACSGTRNI